LNPIQELLIVYHDFELLFFAISVYYFTPCGTGYPDFVSLVGARWVPKNVTLHRLIFIGLQGKAYFGSGRPRIPQNAEWREAHMKFTKKTIEALEANGKRQIFFDGDLPGFVLRIGASGKKTFYYVYRAGKGRGADKKWLMLGAFPSMTVEQARQKYKDMAAVVQQGGDPSQEVREEKAAILMKDALEQFACEHVAKLKPKTVDFYTGIIRVHLGPQFGRLRAKDINYSEIAKFHTSKKNTPYIANRCIAVLSVFLNWCELHGYREKLSNPCKQIRLYKEKKRMDFMEEETLAVLSDMLAKMEATWYARKRTGGRRERNQPVDAITQHSAAALRLLMFTGARKSEILSLKWSYINFELGIAKLPDSKTDFKVLQLTAPALAILESLPRVSEWVFPSDSSTGHMMDVKGAWQALCRQAGIAGWRIHDFRHAFASIMVNSGASLPIIGKILGHTQPGTTQRYAHLQQNPAKQAAEEAAAKLAALAENVDTVSARQGEFADLQKSDDHIDRKPTLQELRLREGLSQKDLAGLSGVTFQSISALENGRRPIGKAMARRLAESLNVDWQVLVTQ
jgi:integrase/DNA-binding XRE family transcriptional regulator